MRFHVSDRIRRWLNVAAVLLIVSWIALIGFDWVAPTGFASHVGWTILGAGLAVAVVARCARRPEDACSFCDWPRAKVQFLIAGNAVSICERCISASMAAVAEGQQGKKPPGAWPRMVVDGLPRLCPKTISRPLLEAVAAAATDHDSIRAAASTCGRFLHHDLAIDLLRRIPEGERGAADWLNLGFALGSDGRPAEAVAATATALKLDDGRWRPWCLNNAVWYGLRAQPDAPVAIRQAWLRDLEEAKRALLEKRPANWQTMLQSVGGTEAELRRALGDLKGALQALTETETYGALTGERHLIRARVLASSGQTLGRHDAERALELLHPESLDAREARALLDTLNA